LLCDGMRELMEWLESYGELLAWTGVGSLVFFFLSLFLLPLVVIYLPKDYFERDLYIPPKANPIRLGLALLKNLLGVLVVLAGILMLFLPGQGILSILVGLSLIDFKGKRRLQRKLLARRRVRSSVQWIRKKAGREPLSLPDPKDAPR